jgi:hypothetical protein
MEVKVKSFGYQDKAGSSATSDRDPRFPGVVATARFIRGFEDDECGWRFIGWAADSVLESYLEVNGQSLDRRVFSGGFELVDRNDLNGLIAAVSTAKRGGC